MSWNESPVKQAIISFVEKVTSSGSSDYVPPAKRVAVFDNDGTLWPENPWPFQVDYTLFKLKSIIQEKPALRNDPMVKAALEGNFGKLLEGPHHNGLLHVLVLTHTDMTIEEFSDSVEKWFDSSQHPRFKRPFSQVTYQPMQEVLHYLRSNGFKTYIVSGGGADFMRVWCERVFGISPEQIVGSTVRTRYEFGPEGPVLVKTTDSFFVNDREGKPVAIHEFIGRRPIACFGNSDGDKEMLQYTTVNNPLPSLGVLIHHTDEKREYAYDTNPQSSGKLVEALEDAKRYRWFVVNMKIDWKRIFQFDQES
jgi:phosphoglycolate phosphatase-like HAD superfamily hydrolase